MCVSNAPTLVRDCIADVPAAHLERATSCQNPALVRDCIADVPAARLERAKSCQNIFHGMTQNVLP